MDDKYLNNFLLTFTILCLFGLAFFVLKDIILALLLGTILGFMFHPVYLFLNKRIKSPTITSLIMCALLLLIITIPLWFLAPTLFNQSFNLYVSSQSVDLTNPLNKIFSYFLHSEKMSSEMTSRIVSLITKSANSFVNFSSEFLTSLPNLFLRFLIVLFAFFYFLRDKEQILNYIQGVLPFSKEVGKKFFVQTSEITTSILYGQFVIGLVQGIIVGIGFLIFGVPNTLLLTILAAIAGILPIIGTTIIWLPVSIYLVVSGSIFGGVGVIFFGLLSNAAETFSKPLWVSKRAKIHPAIILVGMIGGLFAFGFLGFILGPLALAYLFIVLDLYKNKNESNSE